MDVKRKREEVKSRRGGSAFNQCGKNFEGYDKIFVTAPPSSKGFCFHKNAFTLPPLIFTTLSAMNSEQLAMGNA
jgi:hypothetical protein